MGVNKVGFAIVNDEVVQEAARQEVIRRYFRYRCEYMLGGTDEATIDRIKILFENLRLKEEDRKLVPLAREAAEQASHIKGKGNNGFFCGAALELPDGRIVTGKNSPLLHASASCIINAIKMLAGIDDKEYLISPEVVNSVSKLKKNILRSNHPSLDLDEMLIALSVSATQSKAAKKSLDQLKNLSGCEMHTSHLPSRGDEAGLRRLGINLTCDPNFASRELFLD